MGQKVNAVSLRLEKTNRHFDSCWYDDYNYTDLLLQDLKIKGYFQTVLNQIQYPEGRLLIENLPKKTHLNLFYSNPTRSRQKKNIRFQLQNFKETKKKKHTPQNLIRSQQVAQTKRKKTWKNCLTRFDYRLFEARFNSPANGKNSRSQQKENRRLQKNLPDVAQTKQKSLLNQENKPRVFAPQQTMETAHSLPVFFSNPIYPFVSPLSYRSGASYNVNKLFLDFVLYTGKQEGGTFVPNKWVRERFFVRYLLCFFYCKFLQNKRYTLKNTLYRINTLYNPCFPFANPQKNLLSGLYTGNQIYKSHLESSLSERYNTFFSLLFFRSLIAQQNANLLVEEIVYYLERKIPFRRIQTSLLREMPQYKRIKGIRISCSGRVGGRSKKAQRSKTQSVKIGVTSLGVFSSKIDFAKKSAKTRFGSIGVKVWVCYR